MYDAWGNGTITSASNTALAHFNPFRYRGYVYDEETGLYYLQSRYYDPQTGRFISADSYLVSGNHINGTNMFAYCLNNPVMYVDPRGTVYEVSTNNKALKLFYRLGGKALLSFSGVPLNEQLYLSSNCYNVEDYFYVSLVIFQGVTEYGWDFEVCRSFKDKRICSIVAEYYTWVEGAGGRERVAKEIYCHTFMYYASSADIEAVRTSIKYYDDPDSYSYLSASYGIINYLYDHSDPITVGHEDGLERKLRTALYNIVWRLSLNG